MNKGLSESLEKMKFYGRKDIQRRGSRFDWHSDIQIEVDLFET